MTEAGGKRKERFAKCKDAFFGYREIPFFYSVWFTVLLSVFVYIFWFFELGIYGVIALLAACGVVLALCRDVAPLAPFSIAVPQMLTDNLKALDSFTWYAIGFGVMALGLAIHLIRFRPFRSIGRIKGFPVAAAVAGVVMALGGVTIRNRATLPALATIGLSLMTSIGVFFLYATMGRDDPKRFVRLVLRATLALSFVALAEMITVVLRTGDPVGAIASKYSISTGWGHPNYIGNILARGVPIAIYLSTREKKASELWLVVAFVLGVGIVFTSSRSALLVALVISLACAIRYVPKMEKKFPWVCVFCMIIGITMVGFGVAGARVERLFATYIRHGLDSSGRFDLWKLAWERFTQHPVFGVGFDYDLGGRTELNPTNTQFTPYWYHNTVMQILCSLGVVGVIAFAFYFYRQYQAIVYGKEPSVLALGFTLLLMQGISMLDIYFFTPQDYLQMLVITLAAVRMLPEGKGETWLYPLMGKIKNKRKKTMEKGDETE